TFSRDWSSDVCSSDLGGLDVAICERVPDAGGAYADIVDVLPRDFFNFKSISRRIGDQLFKASLAIAAKPVVVADHQFAGAERLEIGRASCRERELNSG